MTLLLSRYLSVFTTCISNGSLETGRQVGVGLSIYPRGHSCSHQLLAKNLLIAASRSVCAQPLEPPWNLRRPSFSRLRGARGLQTLSRTGVAIHFRMRASPLQSTSE